jgi:hypothetical protein
MEMDGYELTRLNPELVTCPNQSGCYLQEKQAKELEEAIKEQAVEAAQKENAD